MSGHTDRTSTPGMDGMVLTVRVVIRGTGHTRRGVLGAAAATLSSSALAGCGIFDSGPDQPSAPDPLQPLLDEAVALAAAHERAAAGQPDLAKRLAPLAADHRAHIAELSRVIGRGVPSPGASSAPGGASPVDPRAALAELRKAEQSAQRTAATACRTAPVARAALVGSIAACRATHAEALR
jgi:hypothetical protein